MNYFSDLVRFCQDRDEDETRDFFFEFFREENWENYGTDVDCSHEEMLAVGSLFNSGDRLYERAREVLAEFPLCLEAFYIVFRLDNACNLHFYFNNVFAMGVEYGSMSEYERYCFELIMEYNVSFLLDVHNITKAIKVLESVMRLRNTYEDYEVNHLAYLYTILEDRKGLERLYDEHGFNDPFAYLLFMAVLLKHDDYNMASDIYCEFLHKFKYAQFIDHVWDLDEIDNDEANKMADSFDLSFEVLATVPDFFVWCTENKRTLYSC